MDIVREFGLRPIINAVGTATRVGGQRMHPEVIAAMADAAGRHFAIDELQEIAGREIAAATGAESGYVTAGASAGLLLGTAACIAGLDPDRIDRLPDTDGMPNEIIVQRGHRNAYDHALRTAGAKMVEVGYEGHPGAGRTHAWQIEAAISAADGRDRPPGAVRAGDGAAARGRGDRAPARVPRDRRRGRGTAAEGEPAPVHRRGRGPRRVLGRQGDRRAAGVGDPRRAAPT